MTALPEAQGPLALDPPALGPLVLERLFTEARTPNSFLSRWVPHDVLRRLYALVRLGPTSMNCQPMRVVFLTAPQQRERLLPALLPGNRQKTMQAPVTAIVAYDNQFFDFLPSVWHRPEARDTFADNSALALATAMRNGSMQGGYLILAARALGLDCGPMSGFDAARVNAEFFPDRRWSVNFLCNLGYGDATALFPRNRRLEFEEACVIL